MINKIEHGSSHQIPCDGTLTKRINHSLSIRDIDAIVYHMISVSIKALPGVEGGELPSQGRGNSQSQRT